MAAELLRHIAFLFGVLFTIPTIVMFFMMFDRETKLRIAAFGLFSSAVSACIMFYLSFA